MNAPARGTTPSPAQRVALANPFSIPEREALERVAAEPEAATTLASLCGHLPLALRIAGARLVGRPHWAIEHLVTRLSDQGRRLAELEYGPWGVRASLTLSYEGLSEGLNSETLIGRIMKHIPAPARPLEHEKKAA